MKVLLDTATLIAAVQGRLPVVIKLAALKPGDVAISVFSRLEAELSLRLAPKASPRYARLLKELLQAVKILDFTEAEAQQALALAPYLPQGSDALSATELSLVATALAQGRTLITPTPNRFALLPGLNVESWQQ